MNQKTNAVVATDLSASPARSVASSITTRMRFPASPKEVWDRLVFYEEIGGRPPLYLRLLLPVPIRTEGRVAEVGDEARCIYEEGHLIKRLTHIEKNEEYAFEVAEQALGVGGGMRLSGGRYALQPIAGGGTEVSVETRYVSNKRPRWFFRPIEKLVCHSFHRYLLRSMRRGIPSA